MKGLQRVSDTRYTRGAHSLPKRHGPPKKNDTPKQTRVGKVTSIPSPVQHPLDPGTTGTPLNTERDGGQLLVPRAEGPTGGSNRLIGRFLLFFPFLSLHLISFLSHFCSHGRPQVKRLTNIYQVTTHGRREGSVAALVRQEIFYRQIHFCRHPQIFEVKLHRIPIFLFPKNPRLADEKWRKAPAGNQNPRILPLSQF
jgi:hypothetical protein